MIDTPTSNLVANHCWHRKLSLYAHDSALVSLSSPLTAAGWNENVEKPKARTPLLTV
jgi:hypothetical protein